MRSSKFIILRGFFWTSPENYLVFCCSLVYSSLGVRNLIFSDCLRWVIAVEPLKPDGENSLSGLSFKFLLFYDENSCFLFINLSSGCL